MTKIISFDVFDTAIIRLVKEPKQVFSIVEKMIDREYSVISGFKEERILAEKEARKKSNKQEVTFEEIYDELVVDGIDKDWIKEKELFVERLVCKVNPVIYEEYMKCINQGMRVIFTSDMYLSKGTIEDILKSCGYTVYEKVYVSSECGYTKITGGLYKYILDDLEIAPYELLHIGNNLKSDYLRPKSLFINSKYYRYIEKGYGESCINQIISKYIQIFPTTNSNAEKLGYSIMGPFTIGFCDWIYKQCERKERLFFLSRDGFVLSQSFKNLFSDKEICYLRVSRRSLRNAIMGLNLSFDAFCKTIPPFKKYDGKMMAEILYINQSLDYFRTKYTESFEQTVPFSDVPRTPLFIEMYKFALENNCEYYLRQKQYLREYLIQNKFCGNIGIIDLSFKGTAFNLLKIFCINEGIDAEMDGYVVGKSSQMYERIGEVSESIHGWIFENEKENPLAKILISNATLYERFMFDDSGTTLGYSSHDEGIQALLDKNSEIDNINLVKLVRNGIDRFISDIKPYYELLRESVDGEEAIRPLVNYILFPEGESVDELGDMVEDNIIQSYIAKPQKITKYIFHPRLFIDDLSNCFWKQGFIYRLFPVRFFLYTYNMIYFNRKAVPRNNYLKLLREK